MDEPVSASAGSPPQVYGVLWNPYCPGDAQELITYGVKHIKFWHFDKDAPASGESQEDAKPRVGAAAKLLPQAKQTKRGAWVQSSGSFGGSKGPRVDNVLCAVFIPVREYSREMAAAASALSSTQFSAQG